MEFIEWLKDGCLKIVIRVLLVIREDLCIGKEMWFNFVIVVYCGWKDFWNLLEIFIIFGDGLLMDLKVMDVLENVLNELVVDFIWKKGDVVMVDNR